MTEQNIPLQFQGFIFRNNRIAQWAESSIDSVNSLFLLCYRQYLLVANLDFLAGIFRNLCLLATVGGYPVRFQKSDDLFHN